MRQTTVYSTNKPHTPRHVCFGNVKSPWTEVKVAEVATDVLEFAMSYLNADIPVFEAYVRNEFLYDMKKGHGEFTMINPTI